MRIKRANMHEELSIVLDPGYMHNVNQYHRETSRHHVIFIRYENGIQVMF